MTAILATVLSPRAAVTVQLSTRTVFDAQAGNAEALYQVSSDGKLRDAYGSVLDSWLVGGGAASSYEVKASLVSGTLSSGTLDTWLSCSISRFWSIVNTARNNSTKTAVIGVQIRAVADPATILASATITLEAESDNNN